MSNTTTEGNLLSVSTLGSFTPTFDATNAGGHFTLDAEGHVTASGGVGDFSQPLPLLAGGVFVREQWTFTAQYTFGALTSTSYGLSLGIQSVNPGNPSPLLAAFLDCAAPYSLNLFADGSALVSNADGTFSISEGDLIELQFSRAFTTLSLVAINVTTGQVRQISTTVSLCSAVDFTVPPRLPNLRLPNTSHFVIFNNGGDYTITSVRVDSPCLLAPGLAFLGNSETTGYAAGANDNRVASLVAASTGLSVRVEAGPGDRTGDLLQTLGNHAMRADRNVVEIGINDLTQSVPFATTQANIQGIDALLTARGGKTYWELPLPNGLGIDTSGLRAFLLASFPSRCIDTATGWDAETMTATDQLHQTPLGDQHRAGIITSFLAANPVTPAVPAVGNPAMLRSLRRFRLRATGLLRK